MGEPEAPTQSEGTSDIKSAFQKSDRIVFVCPLGISRVLKSPHLYFGMFKRQDWLHLQGQHGSGASDSGSDSDEGDRSTR